MTSPDHEVPPKTTRQGPQLIHDNTYSVSVEKNETVLLQQLEDGPAAAAAAAVYLPRDPTMFRTVWDF